MVLFDARMALLLFAVMHAECLVPPTCDSFAGDWCGCQYNCKTASCTASASGYMSDQLPVNVLDGISSTSWKTIGTSDRQWLQVQFPTSITIVGGVVQAAPLSADTNFEVWVGNYPVTSINNNALCYTSTNNLSSYTQFNCKQTGNFIIISRSSGGDTFEIQDLTVYQMSTAATCGYHGIATGSYSNNINRIYDGYGSTGNYPSYPYSFAQLCYGAGIPYVQYDMGSTGMISSVYTATFGDTRLYCGWSIQVSQTGAFSGEQTVVFACGQTSGTYCPLAISQATAERGSGVITSFTPTFGRYVRWHQGGTNSGGGIFFLQFFVYYKCGLNQVVNSFPCRCLLGYHDNNGTCVECPANSFCPNSTAITPCPAFSTTQEVAYSSSQCQCPVDMFKTQSASDPSGIQCQNCTNVQHNESTFMETEATFMYSCPANNINTSCAYNSTSSCTCNTLCYKCPFNTVAYENQCICPHPNMQVNASGYCVGNINCPANTYQKSPDSIVCVNCSQEQWSSENSTEYYQCRCTNLTKRVTPDLSCVPCPNGAVGYYNMCFCDTNTYPDTSGNCQTCPVNAQSNGSSDMNAMSLVPFSPPLSQYSANYINPGSDQFQLTATSMGWNPGTANVGVAYATLDLLQPTPILAVVTMGRPDGGLWVTSIKVTISDDNVNYNLVADSVAANVNNNVQKIIPMQFTARYIRIYPLTYWSQPAMRIGIIQGLSTCTCNNGYAMNYITSTCNTCDAGSVCVAGKLPTCNNGYALNYITYTCNTCEAGSFCVAGKLPTTCPPGGYCPAGSATPLSCPMVTYSSAKKCECLALNYNESNVCRQCPINTYSPPGSNLIENCTCVAGYFMNNSVCIDCLPGFYCPGGNDKVSCPTMSSSPTKSTSLDHCTCKTGYGMQLDPSLVAWYDFEADSPESSSVAALNGSYKLGSVPQIGTTKYTGSFSARSGWRDTFPVAYLPPKVPINFATGNWTFSVWFYIEGINGVIDAAVLSVGPLWVGALGYISPPVLTVTFADPKTLSWNTYRTYPKTINAYGLYTTGVWRHLVITTSVVDNTISLLAYINGVQIGSVTADATISIYSTSYTNGALGWTPQNYYTTTADYDNFQIYKRALSPTEVEKLMRANRLTDVCIPCYAASYCPSQGFVKPCPMHYKSAVGSSNIGNCSMCPNNSTNDNSIDTMSDVSTCSNCLAGFKTNGTESCTICPAGHACASKTADIVCPTNTYSFDGYQTCASCPVNSASAAGSTTNMSCICDTTFFKQVFQRRECDWGNKASTYCIPPAQNLLLFTGPGNTLQDAGVTMYNGLGNTGGLFTTAGGFNPLVIGALPLQQNIAGITFEIDLRSTKQIGNFYYWCQNPSGCPKQQIWAGNDRTTMTYIATYSATPDLLPNGPGQDANNMYTFQGIQATNGLNVRYLWIYFYVPSGTFYARFSSFQLSSYRAEYPICTKCIAGGYCADEVYTQCPNNANSLAGAINASECNLCYNGYLKTGPTSCTGCRPGYYCPTNTTEFICSAGTFSVALSTTCTKCAANTFSPTDGLSTCTACPAYSTSAMGSPNATSCNCNANYYRNVDLQCVICPAGYKCSGNNIFTICPAGSYAITGQSTCTLCARGTYNDQVGVSVCRTCPAGTGVKLATTTTLFNGGMDRAMKSNSNDTLYVHRKYLSMTATNLTKWSFYAFRPCTVTPVIMRTVGTVGADGYFANALVVQHVGTARTVTDIGIYTFDIFEGSKLQTVAVTGTSGAYSNMWYFGWYYDGLAGIPYSSETRDGVLVNDYVVTAHLFNKSIAWSSQLFSAASIPLQNTHFSISLTTVTVADSLSTTTTGANTIYNCSCGYGLRQLTDGNCQGLCVGGTYMRNDSDSFCTPCPRGSACINSVKTACPTQYSSKNSSSQCYPCPGPDTHTNLIQAMCGLRSCPANSPVSIGSTAWRGLGRITTGLGGNGIIPLTHWHAGYKCIGLVLNASADRPISLIEQTITVTPNQTYALRFKLTCTGVTCGTTFTVTWTEGATTLFSATAVARSWIEAATPYFRPMTSTVTVQFRAQMMQSSATLWLAKVEVVDLGTWSYSPGLQLQNGVALPVRYSANYMVEEQLVLMQFTGSHMEQAITVTPGFPYQLQYWRQGTIIAEYFDGTSWVALTAVAAIDSKAGWTQIVGQVTFTDAVSYVRLTGTGTISRPVFSMYTALSDSPCKLCMSNFWCRGEALNICPLNTVSNNGSSLQTDCYCKPGYYGQVQLGMDSGYSPCSICPMNYRCDGGNSMLACPPGTKSLPGATLAQCFACDPGEICQDGVVGQCPPNTYALLGSKSIDDCICMPGYYGSRGNCVQCESGAYCPGGTNKTNCTANAVSPPGATAAFQCFCGRGYHGVNNTECQTCPERSWCWTGVLNSCPLNTYSQLSSSFQVNCTCDYGYTGPDGGACSACSTGYYKTSRGTDSCTACDVGKSSATTAATSASECALCNRGHFNPFTGQSACIACDAGKYVDIFGSIACSTCGVATWSPQGSALCINCLPGTYSVAIGATTVDTCTSCDAGYWSYSKATSCGMCGYCTYWRWPLKVEVSTVGNASLFASIGSNIQSSMALVSSTEVIVSDASKLFLVNLDSKSVVDLATSVGFSPQELTSYPHIEASQDRRYFYLVQGSFVYRHTLPALSMINKFTVTSGGNPTGATESILQQLIWVTNSYGLTAFDMDEVVQATSPYPAGPSSITASPCVHSSYPDYIFLAGKSGSATTFGFRKYQISTNTWTLITNAVPATGKCAFTPSGLFVVLTTTSAPFTTFIYGMTDSSLVPVYNGQVNRVIVDPASGYVLMSRQSQGLIKQSILIQDARNCGPGLYSLSGGLMSPDQCEVCPTGNICPGGGNITICTPGTYSASSGLRSQGQCDVCPAGSYCEGGDAISLCPLGAFSLSASVTNAQSCPLCPAGYYCVNTTDISQCPPNTYSPAGSSDLASCTCNPGYRCEVTMVVHAEVTLPLTVEQFDTLRDDYIDAVAAAAGVDPSQVIIVSVTNTVALRRRLLSDASFIEVHTSIYGSLHTAAPHLALITLRPHLLSRGLPAHHRNVKITLHKEVTHSMKQR